MGGRNHHIAGFDAGRAQRQMQGVGSAPHAHAALRAEISGEFTLELARLFAENVSAAVQRLSNGLVNLAFVGQVIGLRIGLQNGARVINISADVPGKKRGCGSGLRAKKWRGATPALNVCG